MQKSRWTPTNKVIVYDERKLYNYGINRISVRDYGRIELAKKMARFQEDPEMINNVLDKLEAQGYLSDERRTISLLNQFSGRESIHKTKNRIYQKGLAKDLVQEVIEKRSEVNTEEFPEQNTAIELLEKKFKNFDPSSDDIQKTKERMIRFLASKGFKYDDIKKSMKKYFDLDD